MQNDQQNNLEHQALQKSTLPFVSVIIPARNEEKFIDQCLESVVANDYPKKKLEIIVTDGMSTDETRNIVERFALQYPHLRLLDNPKKILASAWNLGIKTAQGEIIMALNAHGIFVKDYISQCVHYLKQYPEADYVGGVVKAIPHQNTFLGTAIAIVLSHRFGVGNSHFRTGTAEPRFADTAAFGGYRKEVFEKVGLFNEELTRSQDMEFHLRLKRAGVKILLVPAMYCDYYTRSNFMKFWKYSYVNGLWITYPLKFASVAISWRHIVPLLFVGTLVASVLLSTVFSIFKILFFLVVGMYFSTALWYSVRETLKERDSRYILILPWIFTTLHLSYGIGSWVGLLKACTTKRFWQHLLLTLHANH